ncbi:MAG: hypothetical protein MUE83_14230 [Tabrizicola sp.]|nr:hypothetical protein [Tabrizicola sp.]
MDHPGARKARAAEPATNPVPGPAIAGRHARTERPETAGTTPGVKARWSKAQEDAKGRTGGTAAGRDAETPAP